MTQTVQAVMLAGTRRLKEAGIAGAARDAQVLMAHVLECGPDRLILMAADGLPKAKSDAFAGLIEKRFTREPVSHLVGGRLFYERWFKVTSDVLDPRPETEEVISAALDTDFKTVLDLGCGSGAIILTLLAENTAAQGKAADISDGALDITAANARTLGVADRLTLAKSDWFSNLSGTFDLIVSNPPYVSLADMADLQPEVRDHEPRLALTDEADGLNCYRSIIANAPRYLTNAGHLIVEIGPSQAEAVRSLMTQAGFANISVKQDIDGRDRVVSAQKPIE